MIRSSSARPPKSASAWDGLPSAKGRAWGAADQRAVDRGFPRCTRAHAHTIQMYNHTMIRTMQRTMRQHHATACRTVAAARLHASARGKCSGASRRTVDGQRPELGLRRRPAARCRGLEGACCGRLSRDRRGAWRCARRRHTRQALLPHFVGAVLGIPRARRTTKIPAPARDRRRQTYLLWRCVRRCRKLLLYSAASERSGCAGTLSERRARSSEAPTAVLDLGSDLVLVERRGLFYHLAAGGLAGRCFSSDGIDRVRKEMLGLSCFRNMTLIASKKIRLAVEMSAASTASLTKRSIAQGSDRCTKAWTASLRSGSLRIWVRRC